MQAGNNQVDKTRATGDRFHNAIERNVQFVDNQRDLFIRQVERKLEKHVINLLVILHRFQPMVVFFHQCDECFRRIFTDVCALQTTGDKIELFIFQQFPNDNPGFMPGQFAVEQLLAMFVDQRAVFRDKRDLIF